MNKGNPYTVSVVIPVYNGAGVIVRCIDSILAQALRPEEIIVVDDGSTDRTAEQVKKYAGQVTCIHQPNQGVSAARNAGIRAATGQWIAFQDADDIWRPEKLQRQMELLRRNPHLKWAACRLDIRGRGTTIDSSLVETMTGGGDSFADFSAALLVRSWAYSIVLVVKREVFREVGLFRVGQGYWEDLDLYLRIAGHYPEIGFVNQSLAEYDIGHAGNASSRPLEWRVRGMMDFSRRHNWLAGKKTPYAKPLGMFLNKWLVVAAGQCFKSGSSLALREIMRRGDGLLTCQHRALLTVMTLMGNRQEPGGVINKIMDVVLRRFEYDNERRGEAYALASLISGTEGIRRVHI